jgi:hypothetical protein
VSNENYSFARANASNGTIEVSANNNIEIILRVTNFNNRVRKNSTQCSLQYAAMHCSFLFSVINKVREGRPVIIVA